MVNTGSTASGPRPAPAHGGGQIPIEHYVRLLLRRKWLILGVWLLVTVATVVVAFRLRDVYASETLILVDPQKVPESYVKSTVTGDVRNRLGTLSQQILSSTRLQKIIEAQNLYPEERKNGVPREDIITKMRSDISVRVVSDFGGSQDLQAFRIAYSGPEPQLVARVTNQLATLFIDENLKARELQATGTTDFLTNQLTETRKRLEDLESKLRDFKLKHIGEMPEQQTANLQLLSQAQSQLQVEADAENRAAQQKSLIQSMMAQSAPVVDTDDGELKIAKGGEKGSPGQKTLATAKAQLAALRSRYTDTHPDVQKLKRLVEQEETKQVKEAAATPAPAPAEVPVKVSQPPVSHVNPVLQAELKGLDTEIAKHKEEQQRLSKLVTAYRAKLDAIPIREQEITELQRDYEISKAHYSQLLDKQLSAQTATQLEIRQKGEKFDVLDLAQPAERPSSPKRVLINLSGAVAGLVLGLVLAVAKEFVGMSVITSQEILDITRLPVLGEIPVIRTYMDQRRRKMWILVATTSVLAVSIACGAILFYHYRVQI
jgi:succinoglycan biosynthesis transport protein ExoP